MKVDDIAQNYSDGDEQSLGEAMNRMAQVSDYEIAFFLTLRDSTTGLTNDTRKKITLAQIEHDRRQRAQMEKLTKQTTINSGLLGGIGVAVGAIIGAVLPYLFKLPSP